MRSPIAVRLRSPMAKPSRPMRPPKVTLPPPRRPVTSSTRRPLASNETRPLIDFERVRQREMPQPPVGDRGAAGEHRLAEGAGQLRLEIGRAAAAQRAEEPLQDAEVRVARRLHVERLVLQPEPAVELQLRALAGEAEPADLEDVLIERQLDRAVVAHAIVEQLEVELLDLACRRRADRGWPARRRRAWCRRRWRS